MLSFSASSKIRFIPFESISASSFRFLVWEILFTWNGWKKHVQRFNFFKFWLLLSFSQMESMVSLLPPFVKKQSFVFKSLNTDLEKRDCKNQDIMMLEHFQWSFYLVCVVLSLFVWEKTIWSWHGATIETVATFCQKNCKHFFLNKCNGVHHGQNNNKKKIMYRFIYNIILSILL